MYVKNCPKCLNEIVYTSKDALKYSINHNCVCKSCVALRRSLNRNCPSCGCDIIYTTKGACYTAEKNKGLCRSCATKKVSLRPEIKEFKSAYMKGDKNPMYGKCGELNPYYGKKHTQELKDKFRLERTGKSWHTEESKKKISDWQLENSPRRGKSVYDTWVEKHGKEIADEKMKEFKKKQSIANSGEKNSMFGKPSPQGSGNGYSGWFKGKFFRSLRELMFIIYANRFKLNLENLEKKRHAIKYTDYLNQERNYFSDYLVNGKYFVEIKPKRLWNTPKNINKFEAAKKFCIDNDLKFKLIDPRINTKIIHTNYKSGNIVFMDKYEKKYLKYVENLNL